MNPELAISGYDGIDETTETDVESMNMTGEIVFAEKIFCGGDCSRYLMNINQHGSWRLDINMRTNGTRHSKRLLVM